MKRALVFQHMDHDHPGRFLDFLAADGLVAESVRLFAGEAIPSLAPYDFLFVLGGAQDTWQEDQYPWLREEKAAIREWVWDRAKPYFGVCLGHQLLCESLGGEVALAAEKEVGVFDVALTEQGRGHELMQGLPAAMKVMQWHMAEVKRPPQEGVVLASSPRAGVQSVAIDRHAMSTQFHCEFTLQTMAGWGSMPNYVEALEKHGGAGAYPALIREAAPLMPDMHQATAIMYDNLARASGLRK
jgi:GMP synthase-like glutamine amidotransferase